ncbi:ATP-binding cassette domain-containing protein [Tamlana crocina]|uniref:ATP-binding cassette domain-containing protein n=1 Tax=Tamlana crocina TaxID=393006 RepID=A0ABX1DDA7_9FLAO|nr:ATP-binding cassette domain-containing protein [Tamlana crocina]NJX16335.1 ATP-binding cassette domain-containing protein [Tamlana crocina]
MSTRHVAYYISNSANKQQLIDELLSGERYKPLSGLKGSLFSEITVNKFIEEEKRHDDFSVLTDTKNSLEHSSQGERKKALLRHLINQNPDYIIVDNVFDSLDVATQTNISHTLKDLSQSKPIIQITSRKRDILPFIKTIYTFKNGEFVKADGELKTDDKNYFVNDLPEPEHVPTEVFNPLVKFNKVNVAYGGRTIVKDICWEIKPGEFWQLVGPNGSGKSTLLTLISGDNPKAYNQDILLFGMKKGTGETVWDIKSNIGHYTSEMLRGFRRLDSIEKMILSGFFDSIGLYKYPTERQIHIAHQWLKLIGLFEKKDKDFVFLSPGHKRLVLIARAMVKHPPLLILDEPTNGLDDTDAKIFSQLINKISEESRTAILYVSHRKEEHINPHFTYQLTPSETGSTGQRV